ncbi:MAG: Gx transporter family protein [Lachnospiraceae bacterium]|nr:Gx transporter family protein [Lachnospiraceae bacterium]
MTTLALFTTLSLIIFTVESAIPPLIPVPGIKLGLANIITLVVLVAFSHKDALLVLLLRILLSTVLFGQTMSLLYSLVGGICCFIVMVLLNHLLRSHWLMITSAFGAISHNLGQLWVAYLITKVPGVVVYLPFLLLSGIITGLFTGLCAHFTLQKLLPLAIRLPFYQKPDDDN